MGAESVPAQNTFWKWTESLACYYGTLKTIKSTRYELKSEYNLEAKQCESW